MTTLLDTSMLIALLKPTDEFHDWASTEFVKLRLSGPVLLSDIVFAEWSVAMATLDELKEVISRLGLQRYKCSDMALFRAGKALALYRSRKPKDGVKRVLPDWIIGAIAETENIPLATSNSGDFVSYFPNIRLISPDKK